MGGARAGLSALVVAVLVLSGLLVALPPAPPAEGAAFATGGSGQHRGDILWLTWGAGANGTAGTILQNGATSSATIAVGDGASLVTTCTLGSVTTTAGNLEAYKPGSWQGDYFDDLYNIGGTGTANRLIAGISNTTDGATVNFRITCRATLGGQPFELPGMVFADAEQPDPNEYVQGTGIGQFSLIERARACTSVYGRASVSRSGDTETMRLQGATANLCQGPTAVSYLNFANSAYAAGDRAVAMDFQFFGSGKSAIAIGIIAPFDVGDAPATYSRAIHVITPTASPVLGPTSLTNYWSLGMATLGLPALRLGSLLDADGALVGNAQADTDDTTGLDDEDGVTMPAVMNAGTTVQIPVVANAAGQLNAWFDWNRNGTFDVAERMVTNRAVAAGTTTLSIAVPVDAAEGVSFARFRLCRNNECASASGGAGLGETEDYRFEIDQASLTVVKDAVPDAAQQFPFSSDSTALGRSFSLVDDGSTSGSNTRTATLPPGSTVAVTETDVTGWSLTDLVCVSDIGVADAIESPEEHRVVVSLAAGEDVVCTFTNTRDAPALGVLKTATVDHAGSGTAPGDQVTYTWTSSPPATRRALCSCSRSLLTTRATSSTTSQRCPRRHPRSSSRTIPRSRPCR